MNIAGGSPVPLSELRVLELVALHVERPSAMAGSNLFTGTLELLILRTLLPGASHGYAIGRHLSLKTKGVLDLEEGVLYPALYRLNRKGLIKGEWGETETGRRARFYSLTRKGRKYLRQEMARWDEHIQAVQAVLTFEEA